MRKDGEDGKKSELVHGRFRKPKLANVSLGVRLLVVLQHQAVVHPDPGRHHCRDGCQNAFGFKLRIAPSRSLWRPVPWLL